jgi:catalase (peroxidase I)
MVISFSCLPCAAFVMVLMYKNAQHQETNRDSEAAGMRSAFERLVSRDKAEAVEFIQGLGEWDKWHMAQVQEMIMVELIGQKEESKVGRLCARPSGMDMQNVSKMEPEK